MTTATDPGVSRISRDYPASVLAATPALVAARHRLGGPWLPGAEGWDPQPCEDSPAREHRVHQAEPHSHPAGQTAVARHADKVQKIRNTLYPGAVSSPSGPIDGKGVNDSTDSPAVIGSTDFSESALAAGCARISAPEHSSETPVTLLVSPTLPPPLTAPTPKGSSDSADVTLGWRTSAPTLGSTANDTVVTSRGPG